LSFPLPLFLYCVLCCHLGFAVLQCLPSFPTRRSSDLTEWVNGMPAPFRFDSFPVIDNDPIVIPWNAFEKLMIVVLPVTLRASFKDRKSTRLNSSHVSSSYAVFCLKKKHIT